MKDLDLYHFRATISGQIDSVVLSLTRWIHLSSAVHTKERKGVDTLIRSGSFLPIEGFDTKQNVPVPLREWRTTRQSASVLIMSHYMQSKDSTGEIDKKSK